jgi:hypothetical protein
MPLNAAGRTRLVRLAMAGLGLVGLSLIGATFQEIPARAATGVPYTDPNSTGYIGLCNQAGQQITSGSIDTAPFVWRAVSSVPPKAPYNNATRTATLYAFLPLQGFAPDYWSGQTLTAAASYSNPTVPMAAATTQDEALKTFIGAYPPKWGGFIQLRIYLDTAGQPALTKHYPTLNIQVSGNTWQAVGGGTVNCAAGTAASVEAAVPTTTTTTTTQTTIPGGSKGSATTSPTAPGASQGAVTTAPSTIGSTHGTTTSSPPGASQHAGAGSGEANRGHGSKDLSPGLLWGLVAIVILVVAGITYFLARRRRDRGVADRPADAEIENQPESDKFK